MSPQFTRKLLVLFRCLAIFALLLPVVSWLTAAQRTTAAMPTIHDGTRALGTAAPSAFISVENTDQPNQSANLQEPQSVPPTASIVSNAIRSKSTPYDLNDGLVLYFSFDNGTATDHSGSANNGVLLGGVHPVPSRWGNALDLNGTDGYVQVPSSGSLNLATEFSISGYVYPRNFYASWIVILTKGNTSSMNTPYSVVYFGGNDTIQPCARFYSASGELVSLILPIGNTLFLGRWNFFTWRYNNGQLAIFLDGVKLGEQNLGIGALATNELPLEIGRDVPGITEFLDGLLDEVRIYNRALSDAEIQALYQQTQISLVSGHVTDGGGNAIAGVTVSTGAAGSATTDGNGAYTISGLTAGTYTLTPSKSGYTFSPTSRTVTIPPDRTGQDFTGTPCTAPSGLNVCALQSGDILLKAGPVWGACSAFYRTFLRLGGTYFTHAALYLGQVAAAGGDPNDIRPRIAEAQGIIPENRTDEVWETWLANTQFWSGECVTDWVVVRPNTTQAAKSAASVYAREKAAEADVVFDLMADKEDSKKFYCSKLAWKAYKDGAPGGPDLEADRGIANHTFSSQWVTPDDLYYGSPLVDSKDITWDQRIRRGFFWIWSPGHLTLIDPQGRRTGFDSTTGQSINEIPGVVYLAPPDSVVETVTGSGVGNGWQMVVTGFDAGAYTLESGYVDNRTQLQVYRGNTSPGKVETFAVSDPVYVIYLPLIMSNP